MGVRTLVKFSSLMTGPKGEYLGQNREANWQAKIGHYAD
jgi:hypothetical protein